MASFEKILKKKKKKNSLNLKENSPESNTGVEGMVGKILQGPYLCPGMPGAQEPKCKAPKQCAAKPETLVTQVVLLG
jgi:hypothetical protein